MHLKVFIDYIRRWSQLDSACGTVFLDQMLLKHTDPGHPDHMDLVAAQREVHSLALKINHMEKEAREQERRDQALLKRRAGADENLKKLLREVSNIEEDLATIQLLVDAAQSLHTPHSDLDGLLRDMNSSLSKLLADRQMGDSQLLCTDLTVAT
ncbi:unnamed protein product, partial [Notodromas monacha]